MALRDLGIAVRVLMRSPQFTLIAVITIALGLGASAAIFSVTNAVLLQPLPYKDPNRLVVAGMELRQRHVRDLQFSNADFIDLREGTKRSSRTWPVSSHFVRCFPAKMDIRSESDRQL